MYPVLAERHVDSLTQTKQIVFSMPRIIKTQLNNQTESSSPRVIVLYLPFLLMQKEDQYILYCT